MVERGPEKAGVGGSIPSLATIFTLHLSLRKGRAPLFERSSVVSPAALRKAGVGGSIPSLATIFPIPRPLVRKGRAPLSERSSVVSPAALRKAGVGGSIPSLATIQISHLR